MFKAANKAHSLILGLLAHSAGVDQNQISLVSPADLTPAMRTEPRGQVVDVRDVHLAAEDPAVISESWISHTDH
jgi:hypothetical protein